VTRRAGPHLGRLQHEALPQRLGQLEQQLLERDGPGEPGPERAQRLVGRMLLAVDELVRHPHQTVPGRPVQDGRHPGRQHRQQQDGALVVCRRPAQPQDDHQVDRDDHPRQAGQRHGPTERLVDVAQEAAEQARHERERHQQAGGRGDLGE
jgi:hypothetical protein